MAKDIWERDIIQDPSDGGTFYDERLDIDEKAKVLVELVGRGVMVEGFEAAIVYCEFPSVEMRSVRCRGDGPTPIRKIRAAEVHVVEDVSPTTGGPRFTDQCTVLETSFVSAEIMEDPVDDLGRYVNCASVALRGGSLRTGGNP